MSHRQLPDDEAASFISKHSIALLLPDQFRPSGVRPVGSGSLVTFDGRHFILTATHVWAELRKSRDIYYSAIAERTHSTCLLKDSLTPYLLDDNVTACPNPFEADLTLLELPPADYQNMSTRLSFFLLDREQSEPVNDWVTIGVPGVLAQEDPTATNTLSMELRAIFIDKLAKEDERDGLDFLRALPCRDPVSPIQDYRGFSGGGLWSVYYYPQKSAHERYEIFLIGVNFYQDDKEIRCLGRNAIKKLIQKVRVISK